MRKNKFIKPLFVDLNPLITEPNKSLTPRQIIENYSLQGMNIRSYESSDMIDDTNYSDDEMVDNTITFEDEFDALQFCGPGFKKIKDKEIENNSEEIKIINNEKDETFDASSESI